MPSNNFIGDAAFGIQSPIGTNSTITPTDSFTGTAEQNPYPDIMISCFSDDQDGTLFVDFSVNGTDWRTFPVDGFSVSSGIHEFHTARKGPRFVRVRWSSSSAPTTLQIYVYYGVFGQANLPMNAKISSDADSVVSRSISEIELARQGVDGHDLINVPARNPEIDTATPPTDIWNGGRVGASYYSGLYPGFPLSTVSSETFQLVSTSANDTAAGTGARIVRVFYLDDDFNMFDSSGERLYFDITLNGTTPVNSVVTGYRVWRAAVISAGSGGVNAGEIRIRWTTTTSVVFAVMPTGGSVTQISNFTVPAGYTLYLKRVACSMNDSGANRATMTLALQNANSGVRYQSRFFVVTTDKDYSRDYFGGIPLGQYTDIVWRCLSVANNNADISLDWDFWLERSS